MFYSEFPVDWKLWLYGKGMPENKPSFDESAVKPCLDLAKKWQDWKQSEDLINGKPLSNETLEKMDEVHKIDEEEHQQVRDLYYRIAMKARFEKLLGVVIKFIKVEGPHKPMLVAPLLKMLLSWYEKHKDVMEMMKEMENGKSLRKIVNFQDEEVKENEEH